MTAVVDDRLVGVNKIIRIICMVTCSVNWKILLPNVAQVTEGSVVANDKASALSLWLPLG